MLEKLEKRIREGCGTFPLRLVKILYLFFVRDGSRSFAQSNIFAFETFFS